MYNEIEILNKIPSKRIQISLILLLIEEYSGWLQHLKAVGLSWGANSEEVGANHEAIKTRKHIDKLNDKLLELV